MDRCPPPRLKLMLTVALLLGSANTAWLHGNPLTGVAAHLHCVNDYLQIINCTLSIPPPDNASDSNSSYWLTFTEKSYQELDVCSLTNTDGIYFCSCNKSQSVPDDSVFTDLDVYEISLCHEQKDGTDVCEMLNDAYLPSKNIKPNPPCCLTVLHNSSQHHFTWKSTYEEYSSLTSLPDSLQYQLYYCERGGKHKGTEINTESKSYSVDDDHLMPGTEYVARVRSSPTQGTFKGEWSDWSSEVHWRTGPAVAASTKYTVPDPVSKLGMVLIFTCVIVSSALLVCYVHVKKWRESVFIPTPAPYFQTLYSDCQGDFKSWVVAREQAAEDMLKAEETLQVDALMKCVDVQEEGRPLQFPHQPMEGSGYTNLTSLARDNALLGFPYAVSTMAPLSAQERLLKSLSLEFGSCDGDSGCWLSSDTFMERDPPWYCNEYCTLSAFQQSGSTTAQHQGSFPTKSFSTEAIGVE
ncbi:interleukin-21 receptor [Mugil cephalus]|uniref:interleukin-21 receptor n=1 Tax=Mugil cephalus TaxID=48193 RepID=UPI001FB723E5|nr:interleukin-21 receptor [Mugil cephalus]